MRLPPQGSDPESIILFTNYCIRQTVQDNRRILWEGQVDRWVELYIGNHYPAGGAWQPGRIPITLNRIQPAIIALMSAQASDSPQIKFTPRETGDPPVCYINENALAQLPDLMREGANPSIPLDNNMIGEVKALIAQGKQMTIEAAATGQPAPTVLGDDALIEVTDRLASDALQTVFDGLWEASNAQYAFHENVLNKNIYGWQATLYEFDPATKIPVLTNTEQRHTFFHPTYGDMRRNPYAIYDQFISYEEAIAKYPDYKDAISNDAKPGAYPNGGYNRSSEIFNNSFMEDRVVIRNAFYRNQPYPMASPVVQSGDGLPVSAGTNQTSSPSGNGQAVALESPNPQGVDTISNQTPSQTEQISQTRLAVRHITMVIRGASGVVVADRECAFGTIPITNNINVEIPFSPLGLGEPKALEDCQMALNRVLSDMVTHHAYNAVPAELIPQELYAQLDGSIKDARSKWNQRYPIPAELCERVGYDLKKLMATVEVPAIAPDFWKLLQFLVDMIDREANQTQASQGDASPSWSGDAIGKLQQAHNAVVMAKSQRTEFWLKDLAALFFYSIQNHMTPEDCMKWCSKYPLAVWQSIHDKIKQLYVDIGVSISSGSGSSKAGETAQLVNAMTAGVPVSPAEILERMQLDPAEQAQSAAKFMKDQQEAMGEMGVLPDQGQNGKSSKNGKQSSNTNSESRMAIA